MTWASDDLTPLLTAAPGRGVGFRQGVITAWDPATAANTVEVGGTVLTNLAILNTAEALLLSPGDVVGILTAGSSWMILGRLTIPASPQAAATLGAGMVEAHVIGNTAITGTTYALYSGPTASTTILPTGKAYISWSSGMDLDVGEGVDLVALGSGPGGATWQATGSLSVFNALTVSAPTILGGTLSLGSATGELATGLAPGSWTFELHSRKRASGGNPAVYNRVLTVMPL